jgi:hypothetical protein
MAHDRRVARTLYATWDGNDSGNNVVRFELSPYGNRRTPSSLLSDLLFITEKDNASNQVCSENGGYLRRTTRDDPYPRLLIGLRVNHNTSEGCASVVSAFGWFVTYQPKGNLWATIPTARGRNPAEANISGTAIGDRGIVSAHATV